jgi:hypothetical protein
VSLTGTLSRAPGLTATRLAARRAVEHAAGVTHPTTPDGRYLVVRGRLWRRADPALDPAERERLTRELMAARRAKGAAMRVGDAAAREAARARVDAAKVALGERGPVWWSDGAPDLTRHLARTGPYAGWYASLDVGADEAPSPPDDDAATVPDG